ncbi:MAG: hypothetical protein ACOYIK_01060, partial [Coriobacteriales bacterium]
MKGKKIFSFLMAVVFTVGLMPTAPAVAEEQGYTQTEDSEGQVATAGSGSSTSGAVDDTQNLNSESYVDDEVIVVLDNSKVSKGSGTDGISTMSLEESDTFSGMTDGQETISTDEDNGQTTVKVELSDGVDVQSAIETFESDPAVVYAQPNYRYYLLDDSTGSVSTDTSATSSEDGTNVTTETDSVDSG